MSGLQRSIVGIIVRFRILTFSAAKCEQGGDGRRDKTRFRVRGCNTALFVDTNISRGLVHTDAFESSFDLAGRWGTRHAGRRFNAGEHERKLSAPMPMARCLRLDDSSNEAAALGINEVVVC